MASDIWLRTILIVRKETRCCHIGYSYRLTARVLLYAPSHIQDSTYHGLCCTSRGAQALLVQSLQVNNTVLSPLLLDYVYIYIHICMYKHTHIIIMLIVLVFRIARNSQFTSLASRICLNNFSYYYDR